MANEKHLRMLRQGSETWNPWRQAKTNLVPDLSHANLHEAVLDGVDLGNCDLSGANLHEATIRKSNLSHANLASADLNAATLVRADLSSADLHDATLIAADLRQASLNQANLVDASLPQSNLRDARFHNANLADADLSGANLAGAEFHSANLQGADLSGARLTEKTLFTFANVSGCRIDRFALECLGDDFGGLTKGQRMTMRIVDGVATLRSTYSGFWQWVHVIALAVFLFPYVWFVVSNWTRAKFASPDPDWIPLWSALLHYIWNGGIDWGAGLHFHWSFIFFVFALSYNVLRFLLLYKTKQLELEQASSGLPAMFSLEGSRWGTLYRTSQYILWVNLLVVAGNTIHFLTQEIPRQP